MTDYIKAFLFSTDISLFILINIILIILLLYLYKKYPKFFRADVYSSPQAIHVDKTPRFGGLLIFFGIFSFFFFSESNNLGAEESNLLTNMLFFGGLLLALTIVEDIFHNTKPFYRFISISIATFLFFYFNDYPFPVIDFPILSNILLIPFFALLFFSFAVISICNGFNLIDGANGLSSMTAFCALSCILFLSASVQDNVIAIVSCLYLTFVLIFLFFNYPFGKIFLGDSGAYFLGFSIGVLLIILVGRNPSISPWNAILILFYPAMETIFSFLRKIFFESKSPFQPDSHHLHLKIFFLMRDSKLIGGKRRNNSLVMPFISVVWATPLLLMPWVYEHHILIIFFICIMCIGYVGFYASIPRTKL